MVIQYFIIAIVFFVSVAYAILLLIKAFKKKNDPCKGCSGCAIHEQMLKNKSTSEAQNPFHAIAKSREKFGGMKFYY